jgi:hypothetical protein
MMTGTIFDDIDASVDVQDEKSKMMGLSLACVFEPYARSAQPQQQRFNSFFLVRIVELVRMTFEMGSINLRFVSSSKLHIAFSRVTATG